MRDIEQLAINKIKAKVYTLAFEIGKLHGELASGVSAGVTIKEGYDVLDKANDDLQVYKYILTKLNK